jgi:hypothetical protein
MKIKAGTNWNIMRALSASLFVAAAAVACTDGPTGPGVEPISSVEIVPPGGVWAWTFNVGDTLTLAARPIGGNGSPLPARPVVWATSDSTVATVTAAGRFQAMRSGAARISATVAGVTGNVLVTVSPTPAESVATVRIHPQAAVLDLGTQRTYVARAYDAQGIEIVGLGVEWTNDAPGVASVVPNGLTTALVTTLAKGYGQVTARMGGVSTSVGLTVVTPEPTGPVLVLSSDRLTLPAGTRTPVRAVLISAEGDTVPGRDFTWSIEGGTALSVTPTAAPGHAVVAANEPGTATLVARSMALESRIGMSVTVGQAVGSMEMRPATLLAEVGVSVFLGVHAWRPDGSFLADVAASWTSSDPSVAQVSGLGPSGVVLGLREGTVEITAAAGGVTARAMVTVRAAGQVGNVIVTPSQAGIWVGSLYRMRARTSYASGGELPGQPVAWMVEDTTVATIEADGLLLTKRAGTTRVFARSGGKEGVAEVRVYATPAGRMVFGLDPIRDPSGAWRPLLSLGDTTWTDASGVGHAARRFLVGGTLEVGTTTESEWEQVLEVETVVDRAGGPEVVARTQRTDRGTWGFGVADPWHLFFRSTESPGYTFEGKMPEAGRFTVEQTVAGTAVRGFVWMLR